MSETAEPRSVLIVDHMLEDLQSLRSIISVLGYKQVQVASSVNMALSLFRELKFDLCFVCYDLGQDEKNGLQLLQELQFEGLRKYQQCFVLIVDQDKSELLFGSPENAPDTYISKPFDPHHIRQRVDKVMRVKASIKPLEVLLDKGEWDEALQVSVKLAQLYPGLKIFLERLRGLMLLQLKRYDKAFELFSALLKVKDESWVRVAVAVAAYGSGKFKEAQTQLDHVLNRQQVCLEAFIWRSRLHRLEGEWNQALSLMRRAVMLQPTVSILQSDLGDLASYNEDWTLAAEAFKASVKYARYSAFQNPDAYFALVYSLLRQVSSDVGLSQEAQGEAVRIMEQAQRDFMDEPVIQFKSRLLSAEIYRLAGDAERSSSMANLALGAFKSLPVDDQAMWIDLLTDSLDSTPLEEQAGGYKQELTRQMANLTWGRHNLKGMMDFRKGDLKGARTQFRTALKERPDNPSIALNLVQVALELCRRVTGDSVHKLLHESDQTLYELQFAALTERQQKRFKSLSTRMTDQVNKQA